MDELLEVTAADETPDLIGAVTDDERGLPAVAGDDAAGELPAGFIDDADDVACLEAALYPDDTDREQTAAPYGESALRGRIHRQPPARRGAEGDPLLSPAQPPYR